jgi:hypothetical protein
VADNVVEMVGSVRGEGYRDADLAALALEAGVRALGRALGTLEEMGVTGGSSRCDGLGERRAG